MAVRDIIAKANLRKEQLNNSPATPPRKVERPPARERVEAPATKTPAKAKSVAKSNPYLIVLAAIILVAAVPVVAWSYGFIKFTQVAKSDVQHASDAQASNPAEAGFAEIVIGQDEMEDKNGWSLVNKKEILVGNSTKEIVHLEYTWIGRATTKAPNETRKDKILPGTQVPLIIDPRFYCELKLRIIPAPP